MFSGDRALAAQVAVRHRERFEVRFPGAPVAMALALETLARHALGLIARTDAPYHDLDHTITVAETAMLILDGALARGEAVSAEDWLHLSVAAFLHDLGYVRRLCRADRPDAVVAGPEGGVLPLGEDATDAMLAPVHVDRAVVWIGERLSDHPVLDAERLIRAVRHTRFPPRMTGEPGAVPQGPDSEPGTLRAADLLGQLADPAYSRKLPALYREFVETGEAQRLGYAGPGDVWRALPGFYAALVHPHVGPARARLQATPDGRAILDALARNLARAGMARRGVAPAAPPCLAPPRQCRCAGG